ncbi:MAG: 50S ribosomal protein L11 methyltransferase [Sulfurimonadaceae bacterium]|nr:50S ribosomal protein L11 methyltransferase [Sulfurimonadaceae bacterium]
MQQHYFCLVVRPSSHHALFNDFLSDTLPIGFEERDGAFIIRSEEELDTISWGLEQFAEALSKATGETVEVEMASSVEANDDWVKIYQQSIEPVEVAPFYIHPTWDAPKEGFLNISIDPALAFGTGHHPTTASCLKAVAASVKSGDRVLDVGCGSGILGIAALKLGAEVDACDTDIISVDNSRVNAEQNGVAFTELWEGSVNQRSVTYDVVIANIVADVLIMLKSDLCKALKPGGTLILSGIMDKYEEKVLKAFSSMALKERIVQGEWVTLLVTNK